MKTIELNNLGAVERLSIPLPEKGGVVICRGTHGAGKSTALRAVAAMVGGNRKGLVPSDGCERGSVEYGKARLTVTAGRATTSAEARQLHVESIESRFDISHLVDPGIDDPERADVARLKALVKLSGCKADINDYNDLLPDNVEIFLDTDTDDPILLQGRVKRALEELARSEEECVERLAAEIEVGGEDIKGIDFTQPYNESELREEYDAAKTEADQLKERRRIALERQEERNKAQESLKEIQSQTKNLKTSEVLVDELQKADEEIDAAEKAVADLESQLTNAKHKLELANNTFNQIEQQLHTVRSHESVVAELTQIIGSEVILVVSDEAINKAEALADTAMAKVERGATIREAIEKRAALEEKSRQYVERKAKAEGLREAAASTEDVLSGLIEGKALFLYKGRLCANTHRSQHELYCELSHGERYRMAIDLAVHSLPDDGLLTICQEAWDSLNETAQREIRAYAIERGVLILTAEASEGELRAEEMK